MGMGPFFRIVKKPGLWMHERLEPGLWIHERCIEIDVEGAESILCSVAVTTIAAAVSDFKTVMRQLEETLREDMEKRAESAPAASRRADVLRSLGYVRVPSEHGPEHWRRTLNRL